MCLGLFIRVEGCQIACVYRHDICNRADIAKLAESRVRSMQKRHYRHSACRTSKLGVFGLLVVAAMPAMAPTASQIQGIRGDIGLHGVIQQVRRRNLIQGKIVEI